MRGLFATAELLVIEKQSVLWFKPEIQLRPTNCAAARAFRYTNGHSVNVSVGPIITPSFSEIVDYFCGNPVNIHRQNDRQTALITFTSMEIMTYA